MRSPRPTGAAGVLQRPDASHRAGPRLAHPDEDPRRSVVVGEILEVDPPRKLSHTLRFTAYDDPWCRVTYELRETSDGVEFTLTSEDIQPDTKTAKDMARGGDFIVKTLKAIVETGRPPLGTRLLYAVFGLLGPLMTPKACRSERWPLEAPSGAGAE